MSTQVDNRTSKDPDFQSGFRLQFRWVTTVYAMGQIISKHPIVSRLMLATTNAGKIAEFRTLLGQWERWRGVELLTPGDWPTPLPSVDETGETFAENARLKAVALAEATGLPALADDSGLCVDALGGEPGLHSARWAGETATDADRNDLLLTRMVGMDTGRRTAHYVCVVSLAWPDGRSIEAEGACFGQISETPQGTNGFGYDPVFWVPEYGRTVAELTADEKSKISHRAAALRALEARLAERDFEFAV